MAEEELIIKEVSYDPAIEEEPEEKTEETDEQLVYRISTRHPSFPSVKCKIIRDGVGIYKTGDDETGESKVIYRFTIINNNNTAVQIMTYGATITSVKVPDKKGNLDDIVLGFDDCEAYRSSKNPYFGATIGRITGVIPQYVFSIGDEKYYVSKNYLNDHHANGGFIGFDKVLWNYYITADKLYLSYMSKDMEEGFPGDVLINRCYELTEENELVIETSATCTKPTPIDITTHVDWNLSSHSGGPREIYKHYLMINANKYAQVDSQRLVTGKLKKVGGTVLDLRIPRPLGKIIHKVPGGGYDHFFCLTQGSRKSVTFAAKLIHPDSGRYLEVFTDQPGLQVYTQNNLYASRNVIEGHPISCWCHDPNYIIEQQKQQILEQELEPEVEALQSEMLEDEHDETDENEETPVRRSVYRPLEGKLGCEYVRHGGIRLVPVNYPEPVARKHEFLSYLVYPGETYHNITIFKFGTTHDKHKNLSEIAV